MQEDGDFPATYGDEGNMVMSLGQLGACGQPGGRLLWSMLQELLYKE